jgi:hypothetical protein
VNQYPSSIQQISDGTPIVIQMKSSTTVTVLFPNSFLHPKLILAPTILPPVADRRSLSTVDRNLRKSPKHVGPAYLKRVVPYPARKRASRVGERDWHSYLSGVEVARERSLPSRTGARRSRYEFLRLSYTLLVFRFGKLQSKLSINKIIALRYA